jgi:hypothetical protein
MPKNIVKGKVIPVHKKISKLEGGVYFVLASHRAKILFSVSMHTTNQPWLGTSVGLDNLTAKLFHVFGILVHRINVYVDRDRFMTT